MNTYFEYKKESRGNFDPTEVIVACVEQGHHALLIDGGQLPSDFFDLSSGLAGELVHRLSIYGMRMAVVVPDPAAHSHSFQDFAREANRGAQFHFVQTREEAVAWLAGAS